MSAINKKENRRSLLEGVSESTTACLITMVQGNILALTVGHLLIAAQTGVIAGVISLAIALLARVKNPWIMPLLLAITTTVVDFYTHPGSFGAVATEAIVTGLAAGALSLMVTALFRWRKTARENQTPTSG